MAMLGKGSASAEFVTCSTVFVYYRHHMPLRPKHALRIAKDPSGLAFSGEEFGSFSIEDRHGDTEILATELRRWIEFMHLEALRKKDGPARLCLDGNFRDWARFRIFTEAQFMRSNVDEAWILAGWRTFNFTVTGFDQEGTVIGVFPDYRICAASRCLAGLLAPSPTRADR